MNPAREDALPAARDTIASVRRAIRFLTEQGDDDLVEIAGGLQRWTDGRADTVTLDIELGLAPGWRAAERRERRDLALLELHRGHFAGLKGRAAARAIAAAVHRYETTSWPRDRAGHRRPDGRSGMLYDALSLGEVPGEETLRRLFSAGTG